MNRTIGSDFHKTSGDFVMPLKLKFEQINKRESATKPGLQLWLCFAEELSH